MHFDGKLIARFAMEELPKKLIGKNKQEAIELLQSMPEIEKAEIVLSPSWQTSFPWFSGKIIIQLSE